MTARVHARCFARRKCLLVIWLHGSNPGLQSRQPSKKRAVRGHECSKPRQRYNVASHECTIRRADDPIEDTGDSFLATIAVFLVRNTEFVITNGAFLVANDPLLHSRSGLLRRLAHSPAALDCGITSVNTTFCS